MYRTILDQLTDGQLEWTELTNPYDITTIGSGSTGYKEGCHYKEYPIYYDSKKYASELKKKFPGLPEQQAIDRYVSLIEEYMENFEYVAGLLKLIPLPLSKILIKLGLLNLLNKHLTNQKKASEHFIAITK